MSAQFFLLQSRLDKPIFQPEPTWIGTRASKASEHSVHICRISEIKICESIEKQNTQKNINTLKITIFVNV